MLCSAGICNKHQLNMEKLGEYIAASKAMSEKFIPEGEFSRSEYLELHLKY